MDSLKALNMAFCRAGRTKTKKSKDRETELKERKKEQISRVLYPTGR